MYLGALFYKYEAVLDEINPALTAWIFQARCAYFLRKRLTGKNCPLKCRVRKRAQ